MLISEKALRSIVREMINEAVSGSGSGSGPVTSSIKKGEGGYEYEIFSNGKIQIVSKKGKKLPTPVVLNQKQAVAVAAEQIKLGNKGSVVRDIAAGSLVFDPTVTAAPVAAGGAATAAPAAQAGLIIIGRQDYFPLDKTLGPDVSKAASALVGQGHGFAIVVDPVTKLGYRFDFGRYDEAKKCPDDRWITKAGNALAGKEAFGKYGIHTMGITMRKSGKVAAQVSPDGKQITNLAQFAKSVRKADDSPGNIVVIPVTNAAGALAYANSMVGKCFPYALPGFGVLTTASTLNCGTFAQKVLQAGAPEQVISVEARTLVDTPDALYNTAAGMGYQTSTF